MTKTKPKRSQTFFKTRPRHFVSRQRPRFHLRRPKTKTLPAENKNSAERYKTKTNNNLVADWNHSVDVNDYLDITTNQLIMSLKNKYNLVVIICNFFITIIFIKFKVNLRFRLFTYYEKSYTKVRNTLQSTQMTQNKCN